MIEVLQGTILDCGPGVWAIVLIAALIVIEIFQLGPHSFERKKRNAGVVGGGGTPARDAGAGGKKFKQKNKNNVRQRRRKSKFDVLKNKPISEFILVNAPCAFLFLIPESKVFNADTLVPPFNSAACAEKTEPGAVYPETVEAGNNHAAARGEEADVSVLDRFQDLVEPSEGIGCVCLFSSVIPSIYALHKLVDLKRNLHAKLEKVEMCVLYEDLDEVDEEPERLQEKHQFLYQNSVSLERVTLV